MASQHDSTIFILGIMKRSGTNFINDLVRLHPDCEAGGVVWEDYALIHAERLLDYARNTYGQWSPTWEAEEKIGPPEKLCECLGEGLLSFLKLQVKADDPDRTPPKRLVTKTPSVENLHRFFTLFPRARLLIIVRDGRSVVESGVRSFNWHRDEAMHEYARSARTILEFADNAANVADKFLICKYEDLYLDTEEQMRKVLAFLDLDAAAYDFQAARNLPVLGSSDLTEKGEEMNWKAVEKSADFDPTRRWDKWTRAMHERFNWIAGSEQVRLGYEVRSTGGLLWGMWNPFMDLKWTLRRIRKKLLGR